MFADGERMLARMRVLALLSMLCFVGACSTSLKSTPAPPIDGGIVCGTMTCNAGQICVVDCTGVSCDMASGPNDCRPHACLDLPSACASNYTCGCFAPEPCGLGSCPMGGLSGRTIQCVGCL